MTGKFHPVVLAFAAALAAVVPGLVPALAQQVGTATAVNPSSEGTPPGGTTTTLTIGARVLHKERIHTSPTGSVQLLFLDKSTLSIAPNTSLVIDEFVYDPASGSGHMLTKLTQGTLQYVGGQLSHQGAVTIGTPQPRSASAAASALSVLAQTERRPPISTASKPFKTAPARSTLSPALR